MQRHNVFKKVALVTVALVFGGGILFGLPQAHAATVSPSPTASSAASASAAYQSYTSNLSVATGWSGSLTSCTTSGPSSVHQAATINAVNYYRAMAGLTPVREDTTLSAQAQQAALMQAAYLLKNGNIGSNPHYPTSAYPCYSAVGASTAGTSNLAWGYPNGPWAVAGWVNDSDASNASQVGHRQWVLDPLLSTMGSGTAGSGQSNGSCMPTVSNVLQVNGATISASSNPEIIPWPSAGYFPYELTNTQPPSFNAMPLTAWSVQSATASFTSATVSVTLNGAAVSTGTVTRTTGYGGSSAIIWQMPTIARPAVGSSSDYHVTINGVTSASGTTFSYDVLVFSATGMVPTSQPATPRTQGGTSTTTSPTGTSTGTAPAPTGNSRTRTATGTSTAPNPTGSSTSQRPTGTASTTRTPTSTTPPVTSSSTAPSGTSSTSALSIAGLTASGATLKLPNGSSIDLTSQASQLLVNAPVGVSVGSVTQNSDGTYSATVTAAGLGSYRVTVLLDGNSLAGFTAYSTSGSGASASSQLVSAALGFQPGESVTVTVYSSPLSLGTFKADANGAVPVMLTLPSGFASGSHHVQFVGAKTGTVDVGFQVPAGNGKLVTTGGFVVNGGVAGLAALLIVAGLAVGTLIVRRRPGAAN